MSRKDDIMARKSNLAVQSENQITEQFLEETANEDTGDGMQVEQQTEDYSKYDDAAASAEVAPTRLNDSTLMPKQSDEVMNIVNGSGTKSDKIRRLIALGEKRGSIAKMLGIRYQHVRNVEITPIKRTA
jgi:hypothetical protein